MIIVRGYDVVSRMRNKKILKIRFSGFSNVIFLKNEEQSLDTYKLRLEKKLLNEIENEFEGIDIDLIYMKIHSGSKIGKIITMFLNEEKMSEIYKFGKKDEVNTIIKSYLYSVKLIEP